MGKRFPGSIWAENGRRRGFHGRAVVLAAHWARRPCLGAGGSIPGRWAFWQCGEEVARVRAAVRARGWWGGAEGEGRRAHSNGEREVWAWRRSGGRSALGTGLLSSVEGSGEWRGAVLCKEGGVCSSARRGAGCRGARALLLAVAMVADRRARGRRWKRRMASTQPRQGDRAARVARVVGVYDGNGTAQQLAAWRWRARELGVCRGRLGLNGRQAVTGVLGRGLLRGTGVHASSPELRRRQSGAAACCALSETCGRRGRREEGER
ncbi:hypothetical protein PVAP13_7KG024658 [Panicum virgatum]|uniref:Uncharacterized protein n=1 Tax=Panicum virgatum TaxID=38727 RepID=A0A8T0QDS3_PANVG|nr:hypothetical protein PVAP13_7KG024658 [Panicum virgatum]